MPDRPSHNASAPSTAPIADTTSLEAPPTWLRDLVGAAWAARETFRLMGTPHMLLEQSLAELPDDLRKTLRVSA